MTNERMDNLYYACNNCWHTMDYGQVYAQGTGTCPKCKAGKLCELERMDIPAPAVGVELLCLVCAYWKPWGIFDSRTGVSVCAECRDASRSSRDAE